MARWGGRIWDGHWSKPGMPTDLSDAFARYIGGGKPAFVPRPRVDPRDAIALVRAAGGVPVLAHPFSAGGVESVLDRLVPAGLAGMEVDYGEYDSRGSGDLAADRGSSWADRDRWQRLPRTGPAGRPRAWLGAGAARRGDGAARGCRGEAMTRDHISSPPYPPLPSSRERGTDSRLV